MHRFAPTRFATIAGLALSGSLLAQPPAQAKPSASSPPASTLPATSPTTPAAPPIPPTPAQLPPKRAQVVYSNGTLSISADNASLNQILRQISSDTGMKITGGVADERVFGHYGPDDPAVVLAALLDGTASNMMLVHREDPAPAELILTPRQGGPTPPNPNAAAFDDRSNKPERPEQPEAQSLPATQPEPTPDRSAPPVTPASNSSGSPVNNSQPDSPNGVKTPQQIYEQLQRMRQQQSTPPQ